MTKKVPIDGKLILAHVKDGLYHWIKEETSGVVEQEHIIFRDQTEPLPGRPCVTIKITSGPQRTGYQDHVVSKPDMTFVVGGQRVMIASIQTFGNTAIHSPMAYQLALDLNSSLSRQTVLDKLRKFGIAVFDQGQVTNITDIEETEYEERAEFSIRLGVAENQKDDPGTIASVGPISHTFTD